MITSSTTITLPSGFMDNVLQVVSNLFDTFLQSPLMIILAVALGLLIVEVIIGAFRK